MGVTHRPLEALKQTLAKMMAREVACADALPQHHGIPSLILRTIGYHDDVWHLASFFRYPLHGGMPSFRRRKHLVEIAQVPWRSGRLLVASSIVGAALLGRRRLAELKLWTCGLLSFG
jgi:hypothetical protein